MYFCVNEFEVGVNNSIFSGNEQQKVYIYIYIPSNVKSTLQQIGETFCAMEILFSLMYSRMVLMVVCCRYRMPLDANGCVSTLLKVTVYAKNVN